jgi:membrane protein
LKQKNFLSVNPGFSWEVIDLSGVKTKISEVKKFIETDIWNLNLSDLSKSKAFLIKKLRITLLAVRGFTEDKCQVRASALTFYSLLSIVPLVAMFFGVAKGFGFEQLLEEQLQERFSENPEVLALLVNFSRSMLENTSGGLIAGVGVFMLFWTVMKLLTNIEIAFNDIWKIKKHRTLYRKFTDYLSIMLIAPFLLIISSSAVVFISTQFSRLVERVAMLGPLGSLLFLLLRLLPFVLIWILFTLIYVVMPNTKVNLKSGLFAGIAAGSIYQIVQLIYLNLQVGVAKANAVYGSFAALPLFLVWMQLSWLIVLFGTELSYAIQNIGNYKFEAKSEISTYNKRLLSLLISRQVVQTFMKGVEPLTVSQINHDLEIPLHIVRELVDELVRAGVLSSTLAEENQDPGYQPAKDINRLSIEGVLKALDKIGPDEMPIDPTEALSEIKETLEDFNNLVENSPYNKLIKDI